MRIRLKAFLPVVVLAIAVAISWTLIANRPAAERQPPAPAPMSVDATRVSRGSFDVVVVADGTVSPRTESTLIPEVAGRVIEISPEFREGGFFEEGDVLLRIEPRDYELALATSEAQVAQAKAALEQELALAEVVKNDWKQLGKEAPDLGLRKPQIAAAEAALLSAEAQLERARVDLERTVIRAPYVGRVLEQNADVGQFVSVGTVLARVYAVDYAEIRLPISNRQIEFIDLPERFRDDPGAAAPAGPPVVVEANIGSTTYQWQGRLVRVEGAIDTRSRELFVVAQVDDPYARGPSGRPPLRIGQFVRAKIHGRTLHDVFVVPRAALREGGELLIVDKDSRLERRPVAVAWSDDDNVVISDGLGDGDVVTLTSLSIAAGGTPVLATIDGVPPVEARTAPGGSSSDARGDGAR
jgi:RND family efflux transporter MFP subunit